jgi:hypothetical protein
MKNTINYDEFYKTTKGKRMERGLNQAKRTNKGFVYYTRDANVDKLNMKDTVKYYMINIDNNELSKKMGREHSIYFITING